MAKRRTPTKPATATRRKPTTTRRPDDRPLLVKHVAAIRRAAAVLARYGVEEAQVIEKLAAKLLPRPRRGTGG